jgi:hypothetical protein
MGQHKLAYSFAPKKIKNKNYQTLPMWESQFGLPTCAMKFLWNCARFQTASFWPVKKVAGKGTKQNNS